MTTRWRAREIAPPAVAVIGLLAWSRAVHRFSDAPPLGAAGVGLMLLAAVALVLRRRQPLVALGLVAAAVTAYLALGNPYGPILLTLGLAIYSVARHRPLRTAAVAASVSVGVLLTHLLIRPLTVSAETASSVTVAWVVVPFAIGVAVRQRVEAAEHAQQARLAARVDAERLRLSQDVHDVVGHGLAAIHLQASVALRAAHRDGASLPRAREALSAIEQASAASLSELRTVLHRTADGGAPLAPGPGLDGLPALVDRMSAPGAPVRLRHEGDPAPLPPVADRAAYRVAQEALTNAVRHGRPGSTALTLRHRAGDVEIEVVNDVGDGVPPRGTDGPGMGLPGMRDRVDAVGGTLEITDGGTRFRLLARIPREVRA